MMLRNLALLALVALGGACVLLVLQLSARDAKIRMLERDLDAAALVNDHNVNEVNKLAEEKAALVTKLADGVARSEAAVERIALLELENETLERALLEQHAELAKDPAVGSWMATGMPAAAACSVWPRAAACSN